MKKLVAGLAGLAVSSLITATIAAPATAAPPEPLSAATYTALGDSFASVLPPAYPLVLSGGGVNNRAFPLGVTTDSIAVQLAGIPETTQQVTLTVGGNDLGFTDKVLACFTNAAACALTPAEGAALAALPTKLAGVLEQIKAAAPAAKIYVTGYPQLFQPGDSPVCIVGSINGQPLPFDVRGAAQLDAAAVALNGAIKASITGQMNSWAKYVDVTEAFTGHGLCGTAGPNPATWINPVTVTHSEAGLDVHPEMFPLHPTADGQVGYADAILAKGFKQKSLKA